MDRKTFLAFMAAVQVWKLSVSDHLNLLGGMSRSTYFNLQRDEAWAGRGPNIPRDTYERMTMFVSITEMVHEIKPAKLTFSEFVRKPHRAWDGVSLLHFLLSPVSRHYTLYSVSARLTATVAARKAISNGEKSPTNGSTLATFT